MLLVASAEQFSKLYKNDSNILEKFDALDIKGIISVRNFIAHDYDGINYMIVWETVTKEIPPLEEKMETLLRALNCEERDNGS